MALKQVLTGACFISLSSGLPAVAQETHPFSYCWADLGTGAIDLAVMCGGRESTSSPPSTSSQSAPPISPPPLFATTCSQLETQGEAYYHVYVNGSAPLSLDPDLDGQPCEFLTDETRNEGSRVATYTSNVAGDIFTRLEIWQAGNTDFYVIVDFESYRYSTVGFSSFESAQNHLRNYYGWVQGL